MITLTYDQWRSMKLDEATEKNQEVEKKYTCDKCEGFGIDDDENICSECDGEGTFYCSEMTLDSFSATREQYFEEVIANMKAFCAWCNRDFLEEVGPFVREFRL